MKKISLELKKDSTSLRRNDKWNHLYFNSLMSWSTAMGVLLLTFMTIGTGKAIGRAGNDTDVIRWAEQHFAKGKIPPFSFVYGGKSSDKFIKNWQYKAEKLATAEPNSMVKVYSFTDPQSGLVVKCTVTCFTDFPSVEWVLNFSNTSAKNTPVIEQAAAIDQTFGSNEQGTFILDHSNGSNAERVDFQMRHDNLQMGKPFYSTPDGGRSSDHSAFPFFNIEMPETRE